MLNFNAGIFGNYAPQVVRGGAAAATSARLATLLGSPSPPSLYFAEDRVASFP
jgi:hypothetical protein